MMVTLARKMTSVTPVGIAWGQPVHVMTKSTVLQIIAFQQDNPARKAICRHKPGLTGAAAITQTMYSVRTPIHAPWIPATPNWAVYQNQRTATTTTHAPMIPVISGQETVNIPM